MNHLSDADEQAFEQQLERIGEHLRPAPGSRFYQRLAGAPWQGVPGMVTKQKAPGRKLAWGVLEIAVVLVVLATWYVLGGSAWLRGLVPGERPSAAPTQAGEANNPVIDDHTATPLPGAGTGVDPASGVATPTPTAWLEDGTTVDSALGSPTPTATPLPLGSGVNATVQVMRPSTGEKIGQYESLADLTAQFAWQAAGSVLVYTLGESESYATVAAALGLQPESIAWSNPTLPQPQAGDQLIVPPVDGVVHRVQEGDTLARLAAQYHVSAADITAFAANGLDEAAPALKVAQMLVIPGGRP